MAAGPNLDMIYDEIRRVFRRESDDAILNDMASEAIAESYATSTIVPMLVIIDEVWPLNEDQTFEIASEVWRENTDELIDHMSQFAIGGDINAVREQLLQMGVHPDLAQTLAALVVQRHNEMDEEMPGTPTEEMEEAERVGSPESTLSTEEAEGRGRRRRKRGGMDGLRPSALASCEKEPDIYHCTLSPAEIAEMKDYLDGDDIEPDVIKEMLKVLAKVLDRPEVLADAREAFGDGSSRRGVQTAANKISEILERTFPRTTGRGRRGGMKWIDALKIWNKGKKWCVPRKGTKDYDKVRAIMAKGRKA